MKYLPREVAYRKLRGDGRGRQDRARRAGRLIGSQIACIRMRAARERHEAAAQPEAEPAVGLAEAPDQQPKRHAGGVQQRGRQHEARRIGRDRGVERHLGAMRVAVEHRERRDHRHGDRDRRLDAERHDGAEHEHRQRDAGLDERHRDAPRPSAPPAVIASTKLAGTSHSARPPS